MIMNGVVHTSWFSLLGSCSCSVLGSRFAVRGSGRANLELRTRNTEPGTEHEHEPRSEHSEA
jgi:hypothetical protein